MNTQLNNYINADITGIIINKIKCNNLDNINEVKKLLIENNEELLDNIIYKNYDVYITFRPEENSHTIDCSDPCKYTRKIIPNFDTYRMPLLKIFTNKDISLAGEFEINNKLLTLYYDRTYSLRCCIGGKNNIIKAIVKHRRDRINLDEE